MDVLLKSFVTEKMKELSRPEIPVDNGESNCEQTKDDDSSDEEESSKKKKKSKKKKDGKKSKKSKDKKEKSSKRSKRSKSTDCENDSDGEVKSGRKKRKSGFYEDYEQVKEILENHENADYPEPSKLPKTDVYVQRRPDSAFDDVVPKKRERSRSGSCKKSGNRHDLDYYLENGRKNRDSFKKSSKRSKSPAEYYSRRTSDYGYKHDTSSGHRNSHRKTRYRSKDGSQSSDEDRKFDERAEVKTYILPQFNSKAFCVDTSVTGRSKTVVKGGVTTKTVDLNKPKEEQSVEHYVKMCRQIAKEDEEDEAAKSPVNKPWQSDEEDHNTSSWTNRQPFVVKPANIQLNIPNSTQMQLPVYKPESQLRQEFPVGSGEEHREHNQKIELGKIPDDEPGSERVFPDFENMKKPDIKKAMKEKAYLTQLLENNPYDTASVIKLHKVEKAILQWTKCSQEPPGKFTGSTKVQLLTQKQLEGDDPHNQAWARKDMFKHTKRLNEHNVGLGKKLLEKMGWQPGTALGKNQRGFVDPIDLTFNLDRKGLCGQGETIGSGPVYGALQGLQGRNPISVLEETCRTKGWGNPYFELVSEAGPPHKRIFHFKVRVNNVDYIPHSGSANKKQAKADAAAGALFALGLT